MISKLKAELAPYGASLVAVSKTQPYEKIMAAYQSGQRIFGENRTRELVSKHEHLPKDIEWHFIGHLQTNKVREIAPFVSLIHSVDSLKLLEQIDTEARKNGRVIPCLLEIKIAQETSKYGLSFSEAETLLAKSLPNAPIVGLMGMATNTEDTETICNEFHSLSSFYYEQRSIHNLSILSMGMSEDYAIALKEGATMVRIGSLLFD